MKLSPKKNGKGYISSYTVNLSKSDVMACGFLDENNQPIEVEKIIDENNKTITIRKKESV
ncbi:MAG: hypothetical protein ACK5LT_06485 [Lachnospirales bacterium]